MEPNLLSINDPRNEQQAKREAEGQKAAPTGTHLASSNVPALTIAPKSSRKRKILVMIPAGEVYDHNCVRWYKHDNIQRNINNYHNIGDAFVYDSSLKLLDYDQLDVMEIRTCEQKDVDRYNAEYDYVFLRGSNYINSSMNWSMAEEVISKLKIPVIAFGVGAQAPSKGPLELSAESIRVLQSISDKSESLGVRGAYTAQVLWDIGIRNVRIIGCPTLFRNNDPNLRIDLPPLEKIKKVAFTLRREVSSTYSPDVARYLQVHRDVIFDLDKRFDLTIEAQGEVEEKKILWGTDEQKQEAIDLLMKHKWFTGADDRMLELYKTKLFYSDVVSDYAKLMRSMDLALGFRLHGNLIALANAVPSIYFTYDSRTAEFAETFQIPSYDVYSGKEFVLEEYWQQSRFEHFNRACYQRYRDMREFLDENNVANKMVNHVGKRRTLAAA